MRLRLYLQVHPDRETNRPYCSFLPPSDERQKELNRQGYVMFYQDVIIPIPEYEGKELPASHAAKWGEIEIPNPPQEDQIKGLAEISYLDKNIRDDVMKWAILCHVGDYENDSNPMGKLHFLTEPGPGHMCSVVKTFPTLEEARRAAREREVRYNPFVRCYPTPLEF